MGFITGGWAPSLPCLALSQFGQLPKANGVTAMAAPGDAVHRTPCSLPHHPCAPPHNPATLLHMQGGPGSGVCSCGAGKQHLDPLKWKHGIYGKWEVCSWEKYFWLHGLLALRHSPTGLEQAPMELPPPSNREGTNSGSCLSQMPPQTKTPSASLDRISMNDCNTRNLIQNQLAWARPERKE